MSLESCLPNLLKAEGIYSNDPGDHGGETVFGVDMTSNPNSPVWAEVRRLQAAQTPTALWLEDVPLMAAVSDTYKANYWEPCELDYFPDFIQQAAFGCAVNEGNTTMAKLLQKALVRTGATLQLDGQMGPGTLAALNAAPKGWLLDSFWKVRAEAYLSIANNHPDTQAQFLRGWLNRLEAGL